MLFTKQLIFNSLITTESLSAKNSKTIIILTSLNATGEGGVQRERERETFRWKEARIKKN